MKVLHVAETIQGGVASVLNHLISHQVQSSYDIFCLIPQQQTDSLNIPSSAKVFSFNRTGRNIPSFFRLLFAFIHTYRAQKPDIIHLHSTFAGAIVRCLFLFFFSSRPVIVYCPHAFSFLIDTNRLKKIMFVAIEKLLLTTTEAVICVSNYERETAIIHGFSPQKLVTIYNGVPTQPNRDHVSQNVAPLRLLFVGRFDHQKGLDILLDAFKQIDTANMQLDIIGAPVISTTKIPEKHGNINFHGWLNNTAIANFYRVANAVIVPSRWEGFAIVPLEAMSFGCSVVSSDATSLPEQVKHGETGLIFESENAHELGKILSTLTVDECDLFGKFGQTIQRQRFSAADMCARTDELYKHCTSKISL